MGCPRRMSRKIWLISLASYRPREYCVYKNKLQMRWFVYSRLRGLTARELIVALRRDGFELRTQRGSHQHYRHPDGRRVTVSFHHAGETFPPKTLRTIVEAQAKWTEQDLQRLGLL